MGRNLWSRDELLLAFNLYCKTPFGKIDKSNPAIIELAQLIGRTPSSVSWKLANFARLDPELQARGIEGASHGSKGEREVWDEFHANWDELSYESELLLRKIKKQDEKALVREKTNEESFDIREGIERERIVRIRVNQHFFRETILATYSEECCVTGINLPSLLIASHIIPWSKDKENRVNPKNGLCLNALHDKAFDRGFMTVSPQYEIIISHELRHSENKSVAEFIASFHGKKIRLPKKFLPDKNFLEYHNENVFVG